MRQEVVGRHERRQPRKVGVRGVGCEHEDRGHARGDHVVEPARAEHLTGELADDRLGLGGLHAGERGEQRHADEQEEQDARHPGERLGEAFLASGSLKAWTPLAIASTPVMAVHPEANALSTRNRPSDCIASIGSCGAGTAKPSPVANRTSPDDHHEADQQDEDERGPGEDRARFLHAAQVGDQSRSTKTIAIGTVYLMTCGCAEVMAATAAEIDTATVRM